MQIKTTMRYHWSEWSSSKSLQAINAGEGVEKGEHFCTVGGKYIDTASVDENMEIP